MSPFPLFFIFLPAVPPALPWTLSAADQILLGSLSPPSPLLTCFLPPSAPALAAQALLRTSPPPAGTPSPGSKTPGKQDM